MAIRKKSRSSGTSSGVSTRGGSSSGTTRPSGRWTPTKGGPTGNGYGNWFDPTNGASTTANTNGWMDQYINALLSSNSNSLADVFATAENNGVSVSDEQRDALFQTLMQYLVTVDQRQYNQQMTQEQRQYDWGLKSEQRIYDSPTNQLARLMGAGISRDAALQMMSGDGSSSSGIGAGGSPVTQQPMPAGGVPAPSGTMDLQKTNTAINALCQLVQTGVQVAEAVPQIEMMQAQSYMTQQQLSAFKDTEEVTQMLQSLQNTKQLDKSELDQISNGNDLVDYLQKVAPDNDWVNQLVKSRPYQRMLGSQFGRTQFNSWWKSVRDTRDSGTIADEFINNQHLTNALTTANIEKVGAESKKIGVDTQAVYQSMVESCARVSQIDADIRLKDAQGNWISLQSEYYPDLVQSEIGLNKANARNAYANANVADAQEKLLTQSFDYNDAGFPMLKEARILEIQDELEKWQMLRNNRDYTPKEKQEKLTARQRYWLMQRDNAYVGAYLQQIYNGAVSGFADDNPNLWKMACGFHYSGASDLISSGAEGAGAVTGAAVGAGKLMLKFVP